jgi:hypothetical protein
MLEISLSARPFDQWFARVMPTETVQSTPLRHFQAALACRTQNSLRDAPANFDAFSIGDGVRTPAQVVRHMTSAWLCKNLLRRRQVPTRSPAIFQAEIDHFHDMLQDLAGQLKTGTPLRATSPERLLQGPFSDAMSHAGQLAAEYGFTDVDGSQWPPFQIKPGV